MAIEKEQHKSEIENIISRLSTAGVQVDEKEKQEIEHKFIQLVDYRVQPTEAIRTVTLAMLKKHGIETKYWGAGGKAPQITVDQVKADNEWLSLKAKIVQIWENRSDTVARTGLIGDETGVIKFTIFAKNSDIIPADFAVAKAKEIATESLDAAVIEDRFRKEIVGRYYEVSGAMLHQGMLVESIKLINICTQEVLAEALKEAGGESHGC